MMNIIDCINLVIQVLSDVYSIVIYKIRETIMEERKTYKCGINEYLIEYEK